MKKLYLITTSLFASVNIFAALQVSTLNTPAVINFDEHVGWESGDVNPANSVYKLDTTGATTLQRVVEHGHSNWGNAANLEGAFSAQAWQYKHDFYDPDNAGPLVAGDIANPNFSDWDDNGTTTGRFNTVAGLWLAKDAFGSSGNWGLLLAPSTNFNSSGNASMWLTLRIQNMTGFTVDNWNITLDAWMNDTGTINQYSNLILSYSTNNTDFTVLDTVAGATTTSLTYQGNQGGSITATVEDGDYLYFRMHSSRVDGNGTAWGIDDINVTAVPEPSVYALFLGVLTLGAIVIRRRKH